MKSSAVLVIDDHPASLEALRITLEEAGHTARLAKTGQGGIKAAHDHPPDLILLDLRLPDLDGYEVCRRLKSDPRSAAIPVIFISGVTDTDVKVKGFKTGAVDYITKPFRLVEVLARVETQLTIHHLRLEAKAQRAFLEHKLAVAQALLKEARLRAEGPLVGSSETVQKLREAIRQAARGPGSVLLVGPRGAGQESIARSLHFESDRRDQPFLTTVDAQDLNAALLGSDDAPGAIELAAGGTLYIDDLAGLSAAARDRLLRSGEGPAPDIRFITTRALGETASIDPELASVLDGRRLHLPSIDERREDLPELTEHFLAAAARKFGKPARRFAPETAALMRSYAWPGEIEEIKSFIERAVLIADSEEVEIDPGLFVGGSNIKGYTLLEPLAEGGMGEIWKARHRLLARPAAVKFVRRDRCDNPGYADTFFEREARLTSRLECPHTVKLYDFGRSDDGRYYYVMELLRGLDLQELVERRGPLPVAQVIRLLSQACRSLAEAHAHGLIHRDIKPANLFLARIGLEYDFLKILDFGLVKVRTNGAGAGGGPMACTPAFAAPEATSGEAYDERVDLYSLGCVAFYLLTGQMLFEARDSGAWLVAHATTPPPRPTLYRPDLPEPLVELVMSCLAKDPEERIASAELLGERLDALALDAPWTRRDAERSWHEDSAIHKILNTEDETCDPPTEIRRPL